MGLGAGDRAHPFPRSLPLDNTHQRLTSISVYPAFKDLNKNSFRKENKVESENFFLLGFYSLLWNEEERLTLIISETGWILTHHKICYQGLDRSSEYYLGLTRPTTSGLSNVTEKLSQTRVT